MLKLKLLFFLLISLSFELFPQVIHETGDPQVHKFLNRLHQKNLIDYNPSVYPLSKSEISEQLISIIPNTIEELSERKALSAKRKASVVKNPFYSTDLTSSLLNFSTSPSLPPSLTQLDILQVLWYFQKYSLEVGHNKSVFGQFSYKDDNFAMRLYPIAGYGISMTGDKNGHTRKIGAHIDAYLGDNLGIMFEYLDTGEYGDNIDRDKKYSPDTGYWIKSFKNNIEFSDVRGQINYNWDWGVISLKKDYNKWGHGKYGQLILSDKAPSYPHIQLSLQPTEWLSINYIHGWLNSLIIDSTKSFYYSSSNIEPRLFEEYKNKFIAANYISIMPNDWLTFSMGNSFIYSGNLKPEMFIPVMYYKVMDHNSGRADKGDGNGILYFDLGINYPNNYLFYATAIIDVLNIREMLEGKWYRQWVGYTIGGSAIDLGIDNSEIRIEYTRTNPWIYENKFALTNYKHINYSLGHWIGQNADLLSLEYRYSFIRGMNISLLWQRFRKGDMLDIYYAYNDPLELGFLYGEQRAESRVQFSIDYEPYHNVYLQGYWSYSDISDEKEGRSLDFELGNKHSFRASIAYGLAF